MFSLCIVGVRTEVLRIVVLRIVRVRAEVLQAKSCTRLCVTRV